VKGHIVDRGGAWLHLFSPPYAMRACFAKGFFGKAARPHGPLAKSLLTALALTSTLASCVTEGDFGRRQPSVLTDSLLPAVGRRVAAYDGQATSEFRLTDDEQQLRDRSWRFLLPASSQDVFGEILTQMRFVRLLPARFAPVRPASYYDGLMKTDWGSSHPPYRQLIDDMTADRTLLEPFFACADRVLAADRKREKSLDYIRDLQPIERENAQARMAENQHLLWWVDDALEIRVDAYEYALDRLFIELPERDAVEAERQLRALEAMAGLPHRPFGKQPADAKPAASPAPAVPPKGYFPWGEDETVPQK